MEVNIMKTDQQVKRLVEMSQNKRLYQAADKAGMSEKTARKYLKLKKLPSEIKPIHNWKTHKDIFEGIWPRIKEMLDINPGLEATTILPYLQQEYPGQYKESALRTLQRRIKNWRATEGPSKDIMFDQIHYPGNLSQSDFTHMDEVGVTILGEHFKHMVYHFILTYSNWEHVKICFSESFESFSDGFQESFWELGGITKSHQTDQLSAAVQKIGDKSTFTKRYQGLLNHYRVKGQKIQVREPHENGDIEQRHHRFKNAVKQALMLRGTSEFESRLAYNTFLMTLLKQLNAGRQTKFNEDQTKLNPLPTSKLDTIKYIECRVRSGSTVSIDGNTYSVKSQLIGEKIKAKVFSEKIEIWLGQKKQDQFPRLIGRGKAEINYRHIIDSLIKKPGAFLNYRFRDDLFPTSQFRLAYDWLCQHMSTKSSKNYLKILYLAAKVNETKVDQALTWLFDQDLPIEYEFVEDLVKNTDRLPTIQQLTIPDPDIHAYDQLLTTAVK